MCHCFMAWIIKMDKGPYFWFDYDNKMNYKYAPHTGLELSIWAVVSIQPHILEEEINEGKYIWDTLNRI